MDLATIIGISGGLILVLFSVAFRGGLEALMSFIDIPSVMITFGGTFAAVLVNFPMEQFLNSFKIVKKVFTEKQEDPSEYINTFRTLIIKASREGILSLEADLKDMENEFLKNGVRKVIDGQSYETIREEMETELAFTRQRHRLGQEIFVTLGSYAPGFGMIGTIMGLILMLARLEDQAQIAAGMAVALLTTFYGALAAYLIFLPIAGKLKQRSDEEIFIKRVVIRGVLSLQSGEIPSIAVAKLRAYIPRTAYMETPKKDKDKSSKKASGRRRKERTRPDRRRRER
ncbi:MAG: motility protein A [Elusimicrobia bacterium]|nr:motility protein A [Elusimicrobiota bacterium]